MAATPSGTTGAQGPRPEPSSVERLVQRWRPQKPRRLTVAEWRVEVALAVALLAVAAAMPLVLPSERDLSGGVLIVLLAAHVVAARIRVYIGAGAGMPTQLLLVPMLFLLPVVVVPAVVVCGLVLAASVEVLRARAYPERLVTAVGDAWHAVGASVVLALAGEPTLAPGAWAALGAALIAQLCADLGSGVLREWLGRGIAPGLQLRVMASVQLIDVCLTPIGLLAALAGTQQRFGFVVVLPLLLLLAAFASDRRRRIVEVASRLDELQDERRRLDRAIHRIGDVFASKLDRGALAHIALGTAMEALEATRGWVEVCGRRMEAGRADSGLDRLLARAVAEVRTGGAPRVVHGGGDRHALACPLGSADGETLAVARCGPAYSEQERDLLVHLAGQARIAMENVDLHDRLRRQAITDELTGLSNHRRFQEILGDEFRRSRRSGSPMALVMLDVDNFKSVNDNHGHQQGDVVLRHVAEAVVGRCRVTDSPARYGGEEIAVVLPDTDLAGGFAAAEAIRRAVEQAEVPLADGSPLRVTVSAGVSTSRGMDDPEALMAAADAALYEAKRTGKNRTVCGRAPEGSGEQVADRVAPRRFADAPRS